MRPFYFYTQIALATVSALALAFGLTRLDEAHAQSQSTRTETRASYPASIAKRLMTEPATEEAAKAIPKVIGGRMPSLESSPGKPP